MRLCIRILLHRLYVLYTFIIIRTSVGTQVKHYGRINRPPNLLTLKTKTTTTTITTAENLYCNRGGLWLSLATLGIILVVFTRVHGVKCARARTHTGELKNLLNTITVGTKRVPLIL